MKYETVIGLEVHVELNTKTKLFCGCGNIFGSPPNSNVCPVCLGMPGVLPVLNKKAIEKHILSALAIGCDIPPYCKFDRKNYFYPDMPKNYQISQYDLPLALKGKIDITLPDGTTKTIGVTRIHLEEDAGKLIHGGETGSIADSEVTMVNYNRAGVPLMEIVSEPDMRSPEEAYQYLTELKKILVWLGVSDCKMEEGSLRCDANISLREWGAPEFGAKVEIKNMNSFKSVRTALEFEEKRQEKALDEKEEIFQETRGWEEGKGITISMRSKEFAHDYRYFPEPDIPPLKIEKEWLDQVRLQLPELPNDRMQRFINQYEIPPYDAGVLTGSRVFSEFFEEAVKACGDAKQVSNWMMGDILSYLNSKGIEIQESKLTPTALGKMVDMIAKNVISGKIGKNLIAELLEKGGDPEKTVKEKGWVQVSSDNELMPVIKKVIDDNPDTLQKYLDGKDSVKGFFTGQIMKATRGRANPGVVNKLLDEELGRRKQGE